MVEPDKEHLQGQSTAELPRKAPRRNTRALVIVVCMGLLLVGVAWFYFNGLPLPMTAADRAALLTGRDLEPWVPGLSAMRGSESFRKRMTFLFGWGVDVEYNFENAREAAVPFSMRCTTTLRGTQEEAAGTFKALSSAGSASLLAVRLAAKLSQPSTPAPSVVERNDLLKWGDASWCITMELEKHFALVFSARRGRHVFTLLIVGPRLEDEVLRKVLLSRLEYLELG